MYPSKVLRIALAALSALVLSAPVQAQLFRAYLASDGLDANACTLPSPCRLLPRALTVVADGGEIWMLDSANYNTAQVEVTKSVTILAIPGALGSVVASAGRALNINTAGVKVTLRNLVIVPLPGGGGTSGVYMTDGARLSIEGCAISGMPAIGYGIYAGTAAQVRIVDTVVRDNVVGVYLEKGAAATISTSKILGNSDVGVFVNGFVNTQTTAAISDTTVAGSSVGIYTQADDMSAITRVSVTRSTLSNNSLGAYVGGGNGPRKISLGSSMLTGNGTALDNTGGGTLESLGNNLVGQNVLNTSGPITTLTPL